MIIIATTGREKAVLDLKSAVLSVERLDDDGGGDDATTVFFIDSELQE